MLSWLRRNAELRQTGHELYERIVAQARSAAFYRDGAVPDTMEGRFEMILLHLFLVLDRLKTEGAPGQKLGQSVMECLFADMDDALRQIGIGDMGVPRRVQKAAAALTERVGDYDAAIAIEGNARLDSALTAHVYGGEAPSAQVLQSLAGYVRAARTALRSIDGESLMRGQVSFLKADVFHGTEQHGGLSSGTRKGAGP